MRTSRLTKTIELTEYQAKLLYTACNMSQGQVVRFLIQYESGMFDDSEALTNWYGEGQKEYMALRAVKEQLGWDE